MPRNWKRSTCKASWSEGQLQAAAVRIEKGISLRKVAKETGIPFSTLQGRIKKKEFSTPTLGRRTTFTKEQENVLAERILLLSNKFHCLTRSLVRKTAFQYAEDLELPHNFNKNTKMAGRDWTDAFLKRNPRINVRKPIADHGKDLLSENETKTEVNDGSDLILQSLSDDAVQPNSTVTQQHKRTKTNKLHEVPIISDVYTVLQDTNVSQTSIMPSSDRFNTYGQHVANKLRTYSSRTQAIVEHAINNILFEADMGRYEENSGANDFSSNSISISSPDIKLFSHSTPGSCS